MLKRVHLIAATALCSLTLGLLAIPDAHAAGQPLFTGQASGASGNAWIDDDKGTRGDKSTAQQFVNAFVGSSWTIQDDNHVLVTKDGKTLLSTVWRGPDDHSTFLLHAAAAKQFVNGRIFRNIDQNDPSKALAVLYIDQISSDGRSLRSAEIFVDLKLDGGGSGGGTGGGFGGF